ncbi:MAG: DUF945 family protein [Pseudomonadota bacterium]
MRKFIVTLGVLLIAVALAGPYFTGKLAEQAVVGNETSIQASLPPWLELVEQTFDRGWFSSRSSARLVITDQEKRQQFEQFLDGGTFGDQPAVLIDSVIAHGPLIGLFTPAIAEIDTAFRTETSEGGYLPVELTTTVGFSGDLDMEWRVVDSAFPSNFGTLGWKGLSVENTLSPTGRNLSVSLTADEFKVERDNNPITATDLEVDWISAEANGQFASSIALESDVVAADNPSMSIDLAVGVQEVAVAALPAFSRIMRTSFSGVNVMNPETMNALEADMRVLLADGFTITMNQALEVSEAPDGIMQTDLLLTFAGIDTAAGGLDLPGMVEHSARRGNSAVDMVINQAMVDALQARDPLLEQQFMQMQAAGALVPAEDGDGYVIDIDYADSLVTMNGLPMPLPPEAN